MNIQELLEELEDLRISESNYFDVSESTRDAYDRANEMLDDCIAVVKSHHQDVTRPDFVETKAKHHYIEFIAKKVFKEEMKFEDALKEAKVLGKENYFRTRYSELMSYWA